MKQLFRPPLENYYAKKNTWTHYIRCHTKGICRAKHVSSLASSHLIKKLIRSALFQWKHLTVTIISLGFLLICCTKWNINKTQSLVSSLNISKMRNDMFSNSVKEEKHSACGLMWLTPGLSLLWQFQFLFQFMLIPKSTHANNLYILFCDIMLCNIIFVIRARR